jgi:integrase/recombinase XerC
MTNGTEVQTTTGNALALASGPNAAELLAAFLDGRNERTTRAYQRDIEDFAAFAGCADPVQAAGLLLGNGHGAANLLALKYRSHLVERGLAAATVNRRLAALRSLVKMARTSGAVPWALEVEGLKSDPYRDTRGPGLAGVRSLFSAAVAGGDTPKTRRDLAILHLLHDCGLRRGEVVGLDLADVDLAGGRLFILGKGRTAKEPVTMPAPTLAALASWLEVHPQQEGPLFVNFDRASKGGRLSGTSVYRLVRGLGQSLGMDTRPHGLRHTAITNALDATGGDFRKVAKFSRHKDIKVLFFYDDNRQDLGGDVAAMVAGLV